MLMSFSRPLKNSRAVAVLMITPTAATATTVSPGTSAGSEKRSTASQAMAPTATSRTSPFSSAARMVEPRQP